MSASMQACRCRLGWVHPACKAGRSLQHIPSMARRAHQALPQGHQPGRAAPLHQRAWLPTSRPKRCLLASLAGELVPMSVKEGDKVLLPDYGGTTVKLEDKE